ncbi:MAG: hypothetical protein AAGH65_10320 [Pseudomonadota bacterium]
MFYLLRVGLTAFEVLVLAAAEVMVVMFCMPFVLALHRLIAERDRLAEFERPSILREFAGAMGALMFLTLVMALFPGLAWLMAEARPAGPLLFDDPAFLDAAFYIGLLLLGRLVIELIEAALGGYDEWDPGHMGPLLHYLVTLFAVAAGSVAILVLDLPLFTLVVFFLIRAGADLVVVRYLEHNPAVTRLLTTVRAKRKRMDAN